MTLLVHVGSMGQLHVFLRGFSVKSVKSLAAFLLLMDMSMTWG